MDKFPFLVLSYHLNPNQSIWRRIKHAFAYIFGRKARYGDWDEQLFGKEEVQILRAACDDYLACFPKISAQHIESF
jgi:hypothetical protein